MGTAAFNVRTRRKYDDPKDAVLAHVDGIPRMHGECVVGNYGSIVPLEGSCKEQLHPFVTALATRSSSYVLGAVPDDRARRSHRFLLAAAGSGILLAHASVDRTGDSC